MNLIDHFAEYLANEISPESAARRLGKSEQWGRNMLRRLASEFGEPVPGEPLTNQVRLRQS